jgi:hypothetical protein
MRLLAHKTHRVVHRHPCIGVRQFAWIADYGFQHSIDTTVNDASRADLASIREEVLRTVPEFQPKLPTNSRVAGLWNSALRSPAQDRTVFSRRPFSIWTGRFLRRWVGSVSPANPGLDAIRIARKSLVRGEEFRVRAAVPTEPFDQALDRFASS